MINKKLYAGYAFGFLCNISVGVFWLTLAAGHFFWPGTSCFLSILLISLLAGDLFQKYALHDAGRFNSLVLRVACGTLITIACLYIFALVLPFGLPVDWALLSAFIILLWMRGVKDRLRVVAAGIKTPEVILFVLAPILVTIWCRDLLLPVSIDGAVTTIHAWADIFYHMAVITSLAHSHGLPSLSDVLMAGTHPQPYHMASYIFPALLVATSNISSLAAYCGFLVPFGILLTVYSCYALTSSVFGAWPGLAASLALLSLPDAFQQGFGNHWFSYSWLEQIAPASGYGLASAAISFLLIFEFCRSQQWKYLLCGYAFGILTLLLKAQLFVAISFLVFVYPALFMTGIRWQFRVLWTVLLTGFYFTVLYFAQFSPSVPLMRLDGSALDNYIPVVLSMQVDGNLKTYFLYLINKLGHSWFVKSKGFALLLCLITFGVFPLIYLVTVKALKKSVSLSELLFPILVLVVYLLMATGLSYDDHHVGSLEEILHRPLVWAYFVVCAWTVAGGYRVIYGNAPPTFFGNTYLSLVIIPALFIVPTMFGPGIQTFKQWSMEYSKIPTCQYKVAQFIKGNSEPSDIIQDSMNDTPLTFTGLSMRQAFVIDSGGVRQPAGSKDRLASLAVLKDTRDFHEVEEFMAANKIKFYIRDKEDQVKWGRGSSQRIKLKCDSYEVYGF